MKEEVNVASKKADEYRKEKDDAVINFKKAE